jgi:outer membrane protein TolC
MHTSVFSRPLRGLLLGCVMMVGAGLGLSAANPVPAVLPLPEELFPQLKPILAGALTQSPQMLQRNLDLVQAESTRISTASSLLPSAGGSVSYGRQTAATKGGVPNDSDGISYSFSLGQPVFHWGTLRAQVQSAKIGVLIAEKNFVEAYRQLALQIRSQYLSLVIKKMGLRNAEYALSMATSALALQEEKLRTGTISPGEILSARFGLEEATLGRDRTLADLQQGLRLFSRMTGQAALKIEDIPEQIKSLGEPSLRSTTMPLVGRFVGGDLKNMPQAQVYQYYLQQSDLAYKVAKYRLYPKIGFGASYLLGSNTNVIGNSVSQSFTTTKSFSIGANWTIFDGFANKGSKMSVLATKRNYEIQYENYLRSASEQATELERQIDFSARALKLAESRRSIQAGSMEFAEAQFKQGTAGEQAVAATRQGLYQADLSANMARAELISRWTEFLSTLNLDPAMQSLPAKYLRHAK